MDTNIIYKAIFITLILNLCRYKYIYIFNFGTN